MADKCPTPRTYFVISPEVEEVVPLLDDGTGPIEVGRYVDEVQASSKREAIRVAYADPDAEIHRWVEINRGDGRHPFSGLTVEHQHCEHGTCPDLWDNAEDDGTPTEADCPECAANFARLEAEAMS